MNEYQRQPLDRGSDLRQLEAEMKSIVLTLSAVIACTAQMHEPQSVRIRTSLATDGLRVEGGFSADCVDVDNRLFEALLEVSLPLRIDGEPTPIEAPNGEFGSFRR